MDRWKAEQGRGTEKRKIRREKIRRERVRRKKMQMREKVGKSRNTVFFQWFVAPEGRKVGSLKRRVRSQLARWEMKICTPLWREARFEVKMYKTHHCRTTFGSCDVEKVHAVVAQSTFGSQNVQNTPGSDYFWKLRCWKSARCCGAKHILKSKCTKHTSSGPLLEVAMLKSARRCGAKHILKLKCTKHTRFGPLLEVAMSKKCTPLWREAHLEVKMYKTPHVRAAFGSSDLEKARAVVARSTFRSQNVQSTRGSDHFWRFGCGKSARRCGANYMSKSKWTKHDMVAPLLEVRMLEKCTLFSREAHFQVKMHKAPHVLAPLLEVRMLKKCAPLRREAHFQVKMYKTPHVRAIFGGSDVIEGSLEVKLPTIWTDEKQSRAEAERRERLEDRRVEEKESKERRRRCAKR